MSRFARVLLGLVALASCGKPDASTPKGLVALLQAEIRSENWGGVFDLLSVLGRSRLDTEMREILAASKDARETGVTLRDLAVSPLKDAYVRMMKASTSNTRFKEGLYTSYGTSGLGAIESAPTTCMIKLLAPEDRTETLFLELVEGRWWLARFPWDWRH